MKKICLLTVLLGVLTCESLPLELSNIVVIPADCTDANAQAQITISAKDGVPFSGGNYNYSSPVGSQNGVPTAFFPPISTNLSPIGITMFDTVTSQVVTVTNLVSSIQVIVNPILMGPTESITYNLALRPTGGATGAIVTLTDQCGNTTVQTPVFSDDSAAGQFDGLLNGQYTLTVTPTGVPSNQPSSCSNPISITFNLTQASSALICPKQNLNLNNLLLLLCHKPKRRSCKD